MKRLTLLAVAAFFACFLLLNCVGCPSSTSTSGSGQSGSSSEEDKKDEEKKEEEAEQNGEESGEEAPADEGTSGSTEEEQEEAGAERESVVLSQSITSQILGGARPYTIYLPPSYNVDTSREYPVLYLLHGLGQNHTSWATDGNMKAIADAAIANGTCEEMIIVSPEAYASFYVNGYYQVMNPVMNYEDYFINDFIPAIESAYRIKANRGGRSISGLSMGGYGCTYHAFKRPEMFSSCFAMSAAFTGTYTQVGTLVTGKTAAELAAFPAFVMECGTEDGGAYPMNNNLNSILAQTSLVYTYTTRPGWHDWAFWRECLPKALKLASDNFEL